MSVLISAENISFQFTHTEIWASSISNANTKYLLQHGRRPDKMSGFRSLIKIPKSCMNFWETRSEIGNGEVFRLQGLNILITGYLCVFA